MNTTELKNAILIALTMNLGCAASMQKACKTLGISGTLKSDFSSHDGLKFIVRGIGVIDGMTIDALADRAVKYAINDLQDNFVRG